MLVRMRYPLLPQPDPKESDVRVLRKYVDELQTELAILGVPTRRAPASDASDARTLHEHIGWLHEDLTEAYSTRSGKRGHTRECPVSQGYAYRPGPCNCDAPLMDPAS